MLGFDAEAVKAALDLPPHVRVPALVALGRGAETGEPHHRLPVSDLVTLR
jgi:nitroreductase